MMKHLILLKLLNMMKYQRGLASMVYEFFDKKNLTATHAWSETLATRNKLAGTGIRN